MNSCGRQSARGEHVTREAHSFVVVESGDVIGVRRGGGEVKAKGDDFAVFPNPRGEVRQEWFYFAQRRA